MNFVLDTNVLVNVFRFYYQESFPSFWTEFDLLLAKGRILSVREVKNEILVNPRSDEIVSWIKLNGEFFSDPTSAELQFITQIYAIPHFQRNLKEKDRIKGVPHADPFVIAKAKIGKGIVVTEEKYTLKASRIPNICKKFEIRCISFKEFMQDQNWKF